MMTLLSKTNLGDFNHIVVGSVIRAPYFGSNNNSLNSSCNITSASSSAAIIHTTTTFTTKAIISTIDSSTNVVSLLFDPNQLRPSKPLVPQEQASFLLTPTPSSEILKDMKNNKNEILLEQDDVPFHVLQKLLPFENEKDQETSFIENTSNNTTKREYSIDEIATNEMFLEEVDDVIDINKNIINTTDSTSSSYKDIIAKIQARMIVGYKLKADQILKLHDPSCALLYYEMALHYSSRLQIGSSIIIKRSGRPIIAEVDCITEGDTIDITFVESGEEITITKKDVLLTLLTPSSSPFNDNTSTTNGGTIELEHIQERILLNMSRCFTMLAQVDSYPEMTLRYYKAAILSCTLAITCFQYYSQHCHEEVEYNYTTNADTNNEISKTRSSASYQTLQTEEKARYIRANAYMSIGMNQHAINDLQNIISRQNASSNQNDAKKMLCNLRAKLEIQKRKDKKLAKEMCKWVDKATNSSSGTK